MGTVLGRHICGSDRLWVCGPSPKISFQFTLSTEQNVQIPGGGGAGVPAVPRTVDFSVIIITARCYA